MHIAFVFVYKLTIKKTINASHNASSHLDAIRLALTPGITGTTKKEGGRICKGKEEKGRRIVKYLKKLYETSKNL